MSSTDFDDSRPVLASSFSLSEAEVDLNTEPTASNPVQTKTNPKVKLKSAYRKSGLISQKHDNVLPSTTEEDHVNYISR